MSEGFSEAGGAQPVPRGVQLRQCTVVTGERRQPDPDFPVGNFEIESDEGIAPTLCAIIAVAEIEGKVACAVPASAWHRKVAKRILPLGAIEKAVSVTVDFVDRSKAEGEDPSAGSAKVWFAYLARAFEESMVFEAEDEEIELDILFDPAGAFVLPTAESLVAAAELHFHFVSAASEVPAAEAAAPGVDQRLAELEKSVSAIAQNLKDLVGAKAGAVSAKAKPAAAPKAQSCAPQAPPGLGAAESGYPGADPEVVRAARAAGVPEAQIAEMVRVVTRGRPKLADLPAKTKKAKVPNPLSESEDEVPEEEVGDAAAVAQDPIATAVTKLTQIASQLVGDKKKDKSLDALLDGAGTAGSTEASSVPSSRKYAAVLRALRSALRTQPQAIYQVVEQNMEADFMVRNQMPGSAPVGVSARAWLEMRSRVQGFQTPVRLLWGVAGVLDALRSNAVGEARARCCLLLAQGDQLSIDKSNWVVASEMSLEDSPPMAAFHAHTLPAETEPPYTKLVDSRWMELFLAKLADYDSLNEKKRKLSYKKPAVQQDAAGQTQKPDRPNPKAKAKGKGRGKASGNSSSEAEAEAPTAP